LNDLGLILKQSEKRVYLIHGTITQIGALKIIRAS
jgi:hypothetical protein